MDGPGERSLADLVPLSWREPLRAAVAAPSFAALDAFLRVERATRTVYPAEDDVLRALSATALSDVKVTIVGQDPYHQEGQAHGLAFSVRAGCRRPPSLVNIHKELHDDTGCPIPAHGSLIAWAERGVLLLNTLLTVRAGEPGSHKGKGWEPFTDAVLRAVSAQPQPVVFLLWGAHAQKKRTLIDESRHAVLSCVHPSPLSASKGFFGSKPFSRVNGALIRAGRSPIDWCLP